MDGWFCCVGGTFLKTNDGVASRDSGNGNNNGYKTLSSGTNQDPDNEMVIIGKPKYPRKKRRGGRPTQFEAQLEMAKISWAPVLECLSLLDSKKYKFIEDIPIVESEYKIDLGEYIFRHEKKNPRKIINWITGDQIKIIHDDLIDTFGGASGIADVSQLDALIDRAKNSIVYGHDPLETIVHKAAFLMHNLLIYHQFADGQKRTGVSAAFIFLGMNGYTFWSRNVLDEVHYCIEITRGSHDVDDIARWLSNHIWDTKTSRSTRCNK